MRDFAKSILNYYAAFNETRFRFNKRLPYEWTDDASTLDLSVFPVFERELLDAVASEQAFNLQIPPGRYDVSLDAEKVRNHILSLLDKNLNAASLEAQVDDIRKRLVEVLPEDERHELEKRATAEGLRQYNLNLRQAIQQGLVDLQNERIEELREQYGFKSVPASTFNPQREVQRLYDALTGMARHYTTIDGYVDDVTAYLEQQPYHYVIYDLHLALRRYLQFAVTQTIHVFFHEISGDSGSRYPLFSLEVMGADGNDTISINSVRDIMMLNTPAINSFEFDTVLTTPRACRFGEARTQLSVLERFIQAKFKLPESFIFSQHYHAVVGAKLPSVRYRVGLQAVKDEDRRILDYSELITTLDEGGGRKFSDMVSRYVGSNVENTSNEVDRSYRERYPHGSVERLAPSTLTVPLPLNEAQRKILTAVENPKNEIIVVDGPPGTGKSYTITALIYLANQLGKSVVVTSHKSQALDVIEQSLTEQFKTLHPQAKPSVLRLGKSGSAGGINNIQNTLSSQAVNAARRRAEDLRRDAVASDRERVRKQLENEYSSFWKESDVYCQRQELTHAWASAMNNLLGDRSEDPDLIPLRFPIDAIPSAESLRRLVNTVTSEGPSLSLASLCALLNIRDEIPSALKRCDELNRLAARLPESYPAKVGAVPDEIRTLADILRKLAACTVDGTALASCRIDSLSIEKHSDVLGGADLAYQDAQAVHAIVSELAQCQGKLLSGILHKKKLAAIQGQLEEAYPGVAAAIEKSGATAVQEAIETRLESADALRSRFPFLTRDYLIAGFNDYGPEAFQATTEDISSLEYAPAVMLIESVGGFAFHNAPLTTLIETCENLLATETYLSLRESLAAFAAHVGMGVDDLPQLYTTLKSISASLGLIAKEDLQAITSIFEYVGSLLLAIGIDQADISTLFRFAEDSPRFENLIHFIDLHGKLSALPEPVPPQREQISEFFTKTHRLLQRDSDDRFSNMLNHMGDVARLQTAIEAGKRISPVEASVLLKNLSCIISEPSLISQHFPMEPDMIDILIIDEASQVSIAESLSLMLRARQTIVFGDELQYGAVGAVNVSQHYSEHYFKDILTDFAKEQHTTITEEECDRLAREASANPGEEDEVASEFIPVSPGTREWLKTFSVRTSTLAFAKALQNYSASLNTHFRSFPEIISYSNDVFYRPSQIELITNRIRTKPIGEVLRFLPVQTKGMAGRNINLDEIEAIQRDIEGIVGNGYKGTIGVICSFKEQAARMEEMFRRDMAIYPDLIRKHKFSIWFVGDVQGEERDTIYYSFVQDKEYDNADLRSIYPTIGGTADNIRRIKMQRLNVGFSRAKDVMVFVHSMEIGDYSATRLGDALRHYQKIATATHDHYIEDESIFDSPAEKCLYGQILQTPFFQENRERLRLIAQFEIGQYIRQEFRRNIPKYRVDFLLTRTEGGKEKSLVIEYDGLEFHTKNPDIVTAQNFDQEYLEYDTERQIELESYGYAFLRINKFSLAPTPECPTPIAVLDGLLRLCFDGDKRRTAQ